MVTPTRLRVAQVLAFVALLAAFVGALGPAERVRTTYSWPPRALPNETPERMWFAPLFLSRHRPETLDATIPCAVAPPLRDGREPVRVLTTARLPAEAGGLAITRAGDRLTIAVGEQTLAQAGLAPREGCEYRLRLEGDRWSLDGGPASTARDGELEAMPAVFGFLSELDLRAPGAPSVETRTAVHATRATTRQALAWTISAVAIAAALLLVAVARRPRLMASTRRALSSARNRAHPVDGVVGVVVVGWWVLSPAFFDDGWIYAKLSSFSASGGFSSYYVFLGTNAPLGYWLDWPLHFLAESTTAVLWLRLPALLCVAATWVLCRLVLARVLAPASSGVALWSLAATFLAVALAWGMTLRPEPLTALLVTSVLLCTIRFVERGNAAPLAVAAVLVPLAVTAHPSGIVTLAPLLAIAPTLVRFARRNIPMVATLAIAALALSVVLTFVGSDLDQRRIDTQTIGALDTATSSWLDESYRYELLSIAPYSAPLRRAVVALIALALLAFALRFRTRSRGLPDMPAIALGLGVLLLIPTPSKWPSHFGTFIGLAAIAVASEMAALRQDGAARRGWRARPWIVVGLTAVLGVWALKERGAWNLVDLRTLDWTPAFESWLPLGVVAVALPLLLLGAMVLLGRRDADARRLAPWRAASWTASLIAVPLMAFTLAILFTDTLRTSSWTHADQTLEALAGDPDCGLAEDLLVPGDDGEREPLAARLENGSATLTLPPLVTYFPCARLPALRGGVVEVPDTLVSHPNELSPIRYPLTSPFVGLLDVYRLRELPLSVEENDVPEGVVVYDVVERFPGASYAPVVSSDRAPIITR